MCYSSSIGSQGNFIQKQHLLAVTTEPSNTDAIWQSGISVFQHSSGAVMGTIKIIFLVFKGPRHVNLSWWMVKYVHVKEKQVLHKTWLNWSTASPYLSFDSTYLIHSPWKMATNKKIKPPFLFTFYWVIFILVITMSDAIFDPK